MFVEIVITNWTEWHGDKLLQRVEQMDGFTGKVVKDVLPATTKLRYEFVTPGQAVEADRLIHDYATRACGFHISPSSRPSDESPANLSPEE